MGKPMAWSFSRLNDFEQCPKLFQTKYILKEWPKEDDAPHFVKGRRIHDKLEAAVKQVQVCPGGGFDEEIFDVVPLIQKLVKHAQDNDAEIHTEQQRALTENLFSCDWFAKDTWVRSIFDVLIVYKDHAVVIDWKTGKVAEDKGQLALFAAVVMALYPRVQSVHTSYIFTDHKETRRKVFKREDFDNLWNEFGDRAELIQISVESGNWPAKKNPNCRWCKVRECEFKP